MIDLLFEECEPGLKGDGQGRCPGTHTPQTKYLNACSPCFKCLLFYTVLFSSPDTGMMNLLFSLLFGIPVLCSFATAVLKRPVGPSAFLSPGCNSSSVIAAADLALREINAYQREGYVLGLNRIFDVRELQQVNSPSCTGLVL